MKRIIIFLGVSFFSVYAYSQTWNELNDSLHYYSNKGEIKKGITVGEKAVIAAKKEFGESHPDYIASLNNLALLYSQSGQYKLAETLYSKAIETAKKFLGE